MVGNYLRSSYLERCDRSHYTQRILTENKWMECKLLWQILAGLFKNENSKGAWAREKQARSLVNLCLSSPRQWDWKMMAQVFVYLPRLCKGNHEGWFREGGETCFFLLNWHLGRDTVLDTSARTERRDRRMNSKWLWQKVCSDFWKSVFRSQTVSVVMSQRLFMLWVWRQF